MAPAGLPQVAYVAPRGRADARGPTLAALGLPVLGQAGAAGLVGRASSRVERPRGARRRARARVRPRPARDRRGARAPGWRSSARCSGDASRRLASPARSSCARRRLVRLRGEVHARAGWSSWCRRGSPTRARARARAGGRGVRARRLRGLARVDFFVDGDDVLLNELNTMPGFTADERLRQAVGGDRRAVPRAARPAVPLAVERSRARARAPLLAGAARRGEISEISTRCSPGGSCVIQTR